MIELISHWNSQYLDLWYQMVINTVEKLLRIHCIYFSLELWNFDEAVHTHRVAIDTQVHLINYHSTMMSGLPVRQHEWAWKLSKIVQFVHKNWNIWPENKLPGPEFRLLPENWHPWVCVLCIKLRLLYIIIQNIHDPVLDISPHIFLELDQGHPA